MEICKKFEVFGNLVWRTLGEIVILAVCFQLKQLKKQPEKIQAWTGFEPMTLRYRCNALSTELSSHMDRWPIVSSSYTRWCHILMGSNPVQAWIFSGCFFNYLSWKHTARITISLMFIRSSHIWFSYIHIHVEDFVCEHQGVKFSGVILSFLKVWDCVGCSICAIFCVQ